MAWAWGDQYGFEVSGHHELVFSPGICYLPMAKIFMLLVAIMDWYSRRVLAWQILDTLDIGLCVEALEAALMCHGKPETFSTPTKISSVHLRRVYRRAQGV